MALHQAIQENRETLERYDDYYPKLTLTYTLTDGSTLRRSYAVPSSGEVSPALASRLRDYVCQPEAAVERMFGGRDPAQITACYVNWYEAPPKEEYYDEETGLLADGGYFLSTAQARELAAAVQADVLAGRYLDAAWYFGKEETYLGDIEFQFPNAAQDPEAYAWVSVTDQMTETLACLERLGFPVA